MHRINNAMFSPTLHAHPLQRDHQCYQWYHLQRYHLLLSMTTSFYSTKYSAFPAVEDMPEEENISRKRIARPFRDEELQLEAATATTTATLMVQTYPETNPVQPHNPTPKIVVLGSTGKIGRHIIRNLMSMNQEMKIVAFVRDYERACEVLYGYCMRI